MDEIQVQENVQSINEFSHTKCIQPVKSVQRMENIQHMKNIQPIKSVQQMKHIQPIKTIHPFKNIQPRKIIQSFRAIMICNIFCSDTFRSGIIWKTTYPRLLFEKEHGFEIASFSCY